EAGFVVAHARRVVEHASVRADLHQVRRGDLVEHQAVGIHEEVVRARNARREVGVDEVGPLEDGGELVGGGEVDADLPFFPAYARADSGGLDGLEVGGHSALRSGASSYPSTSRSA